MLKDTLLSVFLAVVLCADAHSQGQKKSLRNQDIVEMVKSGTPADTIVRTIQSSAGHFDLSSEALCALRNAGVSQAVLEAMRAAGKDSEVEVLRTLPAVNLSENFVKASREALEEIERCTGTMYLDQNGVVVPPEVQKFIDKAQAMAESDGEKAVLQVLKNLFVAKLNTNMTRAIILQGGFSPESDERMRKQADADEIIAASESKQRRCERALSLMLNCRTYGAEPRDCTNVAR